MQIESTRTLILGCGPLSDHLIPMLQTQGHKIKVVGPSAACIDHSIASLGIEFVPFSGILMDDLQNAKIGDVELFLALSDDDNKNAMAAQIALKIFNVDNVFCHIKDTSRRDVYEQLGIRVVSSTDVISKTILDSFEIEA